MTFGVILRKGVLLAFQGVLNLNPQTQLLARDL